MAYVHGRLRFRDQDRVEQERRPEVEWVHQGDAVGVRKVRRRRLQSAFQLATPCRSVVSIDEEYALLGERGLERMSQALANCGEYRCDIVESRDSERGDEYTFTFSLTWWRDH